MTTPSERLAELRKAQANAEGDAALTDSDKSAIKADVDYLSKAHEEIATIVSDYQKVYQQLADQYKTLYAFVTSELLKPEDKTKGKPEDKPEDKPDGKTDGKPQSRFREPVRDDREGVIQKGAKGLNDAIQKLKDEIADPKSAYEPGRPPDLEENVQAALLEYEGKQKGAALAVRRFDEAKGEPKAIEGRHKAWTELQDKANKTYTEMKYELAYFYLALLYSRMKDRPPTPPQVMKTEMIKAWSAVADRKAEVRTALHAFSSKVVALDKKKKELEALTKTGEADTIRSLNLDVI